MQGEKQVGQGPKDGAPKVSDFLKRGNFVSVGARTGTDLAGYVCDRDETGLLLDVRHQNGEHASYEYLPWVSIERVSLED
ncbi:hypothetical protein BH23ACT11_BH23ACT11_14720 [soil metagenome]